MKVLMAGGGTGGHINPAVAIARVILKHDSKADILFVGTERGLESRLIPQEGFKLETIRVSGFNRRLSANTLRTVVDLWHGLFQAQDIINRFKPDIVVGTGGYVCGPVLFMAAMKHIPTLIHEQNVIPGITNKILSRFVDKIAVSFDQSALYFKVNTAKIEITGNPVRPEIIKADKMSSYRQWGFTPQWRTILIIGGSRGAERINQVAVALIEWIIKRRKSYQILLSTGSAQYETVWSSLISKGLDIQEYKNIKVLPYIYDMGQALAVADLVVSRAGAIALAEITAKGCPSILIPSPNVANNHQEYNARALEKEGAALVILEKDLSPEGFIKVVYQLLDDNDKLIGMAQKSKALGILDADEKIYDIIKRLVL